MTVDELMRLLESYPPDLRVMVSGYEEGYDDLEPRFIKVADIRLNVNSRWYAGRHDEAYTDNENKGRGKTKALILERPWHDDDELL